jgi:hypothetical protein
VNRICMTWLIGVGLAVLPAGLLSAQTQASSTMTGDSSNNQRPTITLQQAVAQLVAEAKETWARTQDWPTSQSDFADRVGVAMYEDEALKGMARRLHANPALDAYIKWQLLSFVPNLDLVDAKQMSKILGDLPPLLDQPEPRAQRVDTNSGGGGGSGLVMSMQQAYVSDLIPVVTNGVVAYKPVVGVVDVGTMLQADGVVASSNQVTMTMQAVSSDLIRLRQFTTQLNTPNMRLRSQLDAAIPDGMNKLQLLFLGVRDRLNAADPTLNQAMQQLVDATARMRYSKDITPATRQWLIGQLKTMKPPRTTIVRSIEIVSDTKFQTHREKVELPPQMVAAAIANLQGREPSP